MSRLGLALALAVLAAETALAVWMVAASDRDESLASFGFAIPAGVVFAASGLVALRRRPENRTGVYLAAVGYLWLLNALGSSDDAWVFTVALAVGGLVWGPFGALVLAYPTGRLETRLERAIPIAAAALLTGTALLVLLFDRTPTARCDSCPESTLVISQQPELAGAFRALASVGALVLVALVMAILVRRWRSASPALRRLLWPVLGAAVATLVSIALYLLADRLYEPAAEPLLRVFYVVFAAVPLAFLLGVLRTRLAQSSVAEVVLALQGGAALRDVLAKMLGDPSVEVVFRLDPARGLGGLEWVDAEGGRVREPAATEGRAVRFVDQDGARVAAIVCDGSVMHEPELVESVIAAAGLALANERLQAELRAEIRLAATLAETVPGLLSNVDTDGRIVRLNHATLEASGYASEDDVLGAFFWDVFIDVREREAMKARFAAAAPDFAPTEYENTFTNARGKRLVVYWYSAPVLDDEGKVVSIVATGLDITERKEHERQVERQRDFLNSLTEAVPSFLVAVDDDAVVVEHNNNRAFLDAFGWTEEEIVGRSFLELIAREDDLAARTAIANAADGVAQPERESPWFDRAGNKLLVAWTARPVLDSEGRRLVLVSGRDVTVRRRQEEELRASRARIVQAEDEARRRLERNLHDGAQQRLVALAVQLRLAESKVADDPERARVLLAGARQELTQALDELRELARGIHPAVLTDRGLGPALESLVARMPIPVVLEPPTDQLAPAVEAAAYYVVAESLANVAKYANATLATVTVTVLDGRLDVRVADNGVGGADPARGSGLRGLADRVESLEGRLLIESPPGTGTTILAEIPLGPQPPG